MLHIGTVAALVQGHRLAVGRMGAQIPQGAHGGPALAASLGQERDRPVHADRQHVVVGAQADEAVMLDIGAVAVDPRLDHLAGLGMLADLARQRQEGQRQLQGQIVRLQARRQG